MNNSEPPESDLDDKLNEMKEKYDFIIGYRDRESDEYSVNLIKDHPGPPLTSYAEPYLEMCVSVKNRKSGNNIGTLKYGLARSKFADNELTSREIDRERLYNAALESIINYLEQCENGKQQSNIDEVVFL